MTNENSTCSGGPEPPPLPTNALQNPDADERLWAILAHVCYFFFAIIGPLLIMLCHQSWLKRQSAFVYHQARQALVYQLAILVMSSIAIAITMLTCGLGLPLILLVVFGGMVFPVLACLAVGRDEWYNYPGINLFLNK